MSELSELIVMLTRAGIGHGLRHDYDPDGVAVLVETDDVDGGFMITQFYFVDGDLRDVTSSQGEEG